MKRVDFYFLMTIITAPCLVIAALQPDFPLVVLQATYLVGHIFWPVFLALIIFALFLAMPGRPRKYYRLFCGWLIVTYGVDRYLGGDLVPRTGELSSNPLLHFPRESMWVTLGILGIITLLALVQFVKSVKEGRGGGKDDKQPTTGGASFTFIFSNVFGMALIAGFIGVFLWLPSCEDQPWPRRTILGREISLCRMAGCYEISEIQGIDCGFDDYDQSCEAVYKCSN